MLPDHRDQFRAKNALHRHIGHDRIEHLGLVLLDHMNRPLAVVGLDHGDAFLLQQSPECSAEGRIIVHDKQGCPGNLKGGVTLRIQHRELPLIK